VYLPFENLTSLISVLNRLPATRFEVYHPDATEDSHCGNVKIFKPARQTFQQSMARCSGVIGNAGFELASEAIHMGCPLLVKPLKGQVEQLSNVLNLKLLGLAESIDDVDVDAVALWLGNKKPVQVLYPDVARELASWIAHESPDQPTTSVHDLANRVWSQVSGRTIMSPVLNRSTHQHIPV
jgi:uncharacterized protein (TIGR00661 family)